LHVFEVTTSEQANKSLPVALRLLCDKSRRPAFFVNALIDGATA
jgi:hypothetical protein